MRHFKFNFRDEGRGDVGHLLTEEQVETHFKTLAQFDF